MSEIRGASKDLQALARELKKEGWTANITNGGHVRFLHPDASTPVFTSCTTSDWRSIRNLKSQLRRSLNA